MTGFPTLGTALPPLVLPPLSRTALALYAGGSGDHVPLHLDIEFARDAGHPDVIMQGMLGAGYLARAITEWVPQQSVRDFQVRFVAITYPGEQLTALGIVTETDLDGMPGRCRVQLELRNDRGVAKITGSAIVDHPDATRTG